MSSPSKQSYNLRNPAVKRILQEVKELEKEKGFDFIAQALEDNLFEWHFVMRGSPETAFEGGIYHGRILLPADYPMKPPSFMMLTPNGRFQTSTKICLSISSHHPEHWQPSWSVRTAITAMIAFMPTPGNGAIGSLDLPDKDRKQLAAESRSYVPTFGSAERQAISAEMHSRMLELDAEARAAEEQRQRERKKEDGEECGDVPAGAEEGEGESAEADKQEVEDAAPDASPVSEGAGTAPAAAPKAETKAEPEPEAQMPTEAAPPAPSSEALREPAQEPPRRAQPSEASSPARASPAAAAHAAMAAEEKGLTWLAGALSVAIAALLLRKLFVMFDVSLEELLQM